MPAQPQIACYETASFNTASCSWDVTGEMPVQPELACYETATFNTASCSWDVSGSNITTSISTQDVSCNGGNDGSVSLSVSGGNAPYLFSWSNGSSSANLSGLGAGSYSVVITDANGCSANASASVSQPGAIAISLTSASVTCDGNDGGVSSSVSGGISPYLYSWSNGSTSSSINGLAEGSYTLTVTDANNCESSSSINVITDCDPGGCTYVTIDSNDFESGFGIWNDGGVDCARINNATYASSGNFTVSLQDDTEESVVTTNELNLLGFTELTVAFNYVPVSMDNATEDFWLQVSYNGGATFSTIEEWNLNDEFVNDQSYSESVTFQGPFNANTMLRFRCDASGNADWVYIDDVVITGCQGEIIPTCTDGIQNGDETGVDCGGSNCAPCATGCVYSDISINDFEGGLGIWNDGGGDAALVTNSTYSTSGSRSMELRDNSGVASSMTTDDIDLTGYSELTVSFNFVTVSFENNEDFFLEYSLGGGVYSILAAYQQGNNTQNGVAYSDAVVIQGPFTSTTSIRFRCDASNNSDWVYIDDVVISGCYNGVGNRVAIDSPASTSQTSKSLTGNAAKFDFDLFPNPVSGLMNVRLINLNDVDYQVKITDMSGKLIEISNLSIQRNGDRITLDSDKLASGLYNISVHTQTEVLSKRFIVQH